MFTYFHLYSKFNRTLACTDDMSEDKIDDLDTGESNANLSEDTDTVIQQILHRRNRY